MSLSKRNKRGFFIVLLFVLIVSYTPRIINAFSTSSSYTFSHEELIEADSKLAVKKEDYKKFKKGEKKISKKKKYKGLAKSTDPNLLTKEDWISLGLSEKQADALLRFAKRGLKSNEDLKKIYVLPEELYLLIKDSLFYPEIENSFDKKEHIQKNEKTNFVAVEINSANQETLETIPGIGPFFAKNIIQRRNELGGFNSKQQLLEIWKFDQEKLNEINDFVIIDKTKIVKININLANVDELKKHPYISYKVANSIVKMRERKGEYKEMNEIKESMLINEELYSKLLPYLKLK